MTSSSETKLKADESLLTAFMASPPGSPGFFYNFGVIDKTSPFLLRSKTQEMPSRSFTSPHEGCASDIISRLHSFESFAPFSVESMACAIETSMKRRSSTQWECLICGRCFTRMLFVDHYLNEHMQEFHDFMEQHDRYLESNNELMSGILSRIQFSPLFPPPSSAKRMQNIAPSICLPPENDDDASDPDDINFGPHLSDDYDIRESEEVITKILQSFGEPIKSIETPQQPQPLQVSMSPEPIPVTPKTVEPVEIPEEPEKPPQPENPSLELLLSMTDEEFKERNRAEPKEKTQKSHKPISLLSQIPSNIQASVIHRISTDFLQKFVVQKAQQIIRPVLKSHKKDHQQKLEEERNNRIQEEIRQRHAAHQQRRNATINSLVVANRNPIIKAYIKQELAVIWENLKAELFKKQSTEQEVIEVPRVVVRGMYFYNALTPKTLRSMFPGIAFVEGKDHLPIVEYRQYQQKIEALLQLRTIEEVDKFVGTSPIVYENRRIELFRDDALEKGNLVEYNGQLIVLDPASTCNYVFLIEKTLQQPGESDEFYPVLF